MVYVSPNDSVLQGASLYALMHPRSYFSKSGEIKLSHKILGLYDHTKSKINTNGLNVKFNM